MVFFWWKKNKKINCARSIDRLLRDVEFASRIGAKVSLLKKWIREDLSSIERHCDIKISSLVKPHALNIVDKFKGKKDFSEDYMVINNVLKDLFNSFSKGGKNDREK